MKENYYVEGKNFLEQIDKRLNVLEPYFRTRFMIKKGTGNYQMIRKSKPNEHAHLTLIGMDTEVSTRFSWPKKLQPHVTMKYSTIGRSIDGTHSIKLPQSLASYRKTWGSVSLVVIEVAHPKGEDKSTLYYLNPQKIMNMLERLETEGFIPFKDNLDRVSAADYYPCITRDSLKEYYSLETLHEQFDLIEMIDVIDWKSRTIYFHGSTFSNPKWLEDKDSVTFFTQWKIPTESKKMTWERFKLSVRKDQSKPIIVTRVKTGVEARYSSIKEAWETITEQTGAKVSLSAFNSCVSGRTKTVKIKIGDVTERITMRYANAEDRDKLSKRNQQTKEEPAEEQARIAS